MHASVTLLIATLVTLLIAAGGCGDDSGPSDSAVTDSGTAPVDSGTSPVDSATAPADSGTSPVDSGTSPVDSGAVDVCAGDDPSLTVGCNGPLLGPAQTDDAHFGLCTPSADIESGSCTDTTALCYDSDAALLDSPRGVCVPRCATNGDTYVSTSTCPSGTRCFHIVDDVGYCFADCTAPTDCPSDQCDEDYTCVGTRGGVTDGGAADAGVDAAPDAA